MASWSISLEMRTSAPSFLATSCTLSQVACPSVSAVFLAGERRGDAAGATRPVHCVAAHRDELALLAEHAELLAEDDDGGGHLVRHQEAAGAVDAFALRSLDGDAVLLAPIQRLGAADSVAFAHMPTV